MRKPRLAVLIDAENVPADIAARLFAEVAKLGDAIVRRIYGDFSNPRLDGWRNVLHANALSPQQTFAVAGGKNAADIALVIDAMDLLHAGRVDGFCLVSTDSDFTRLAIWLREQGQAVYGFGHQMPSRSFADACISFNALERREGTTSVPPPAPPAAPAGPAVARSPSAAVPELRKALRQVADKSGFAPLDEVVRHLPDGFKARDFGCPDLLALTVKVGHFEVVKPMTGGHRIRFRPVQKAPGRPPSANAPACAAMA